MITDSTISHILAAIKEPFLNKSLADLNLKFETEQANDLLKITLLAGFPLYPLLDSLRPIVESAFQCEKISVALDWVTEIRAHRTQLPGKGLRGIKNTVAIASGKGGVGKSTVTVNLATALAQAGARVGILDADIYGPSIPLMLGEHQPIAIENDQYLPVKVHGIQAMSIGYLTHADNQTLIWRGPMLAKALIQMLDITLWDDLDYLFIDLPPGTGDIQLSLVQKIPLTGAIVVTTPQQVATLDAQKAIDMFAKTNIDMLGIIENMASHHCIHCGHQNPIFGTGGAQALADSNKLPLLGQWPLDAHIREDCDRGYPSALGEQTKTAEVILKTALELAVNLNKKPLNYADRFPEIVVK